MRNVIFFWALFLCGMVQAQNGGKVLDSETLRSETLNEERRYAIYLPPDYETSERQYPVLYLLHPAGPRGTLPNQQGWINYGMLKYYMDRGIESGEIAPMIVVTPDANFVTGRISYFNDPDGKFAFEDFFFKEFIPYIEKSYRCRTEKGSRAIAGASMGGGAAFIYALRHPELFAVSCPLSAAIREYEKEYMTNRYPDMDQVSLVEWYKPYNVYELFRQLSDTEKASVAWYIACGDDDALSTNNMKLHMELRQLGIPHEFRIGDGKHDWKYWRSITPDVLRYISSIFLK